VQPAETERKLAKYSENVEKIEVQFNELKRTYDTLKIQTERATQR